MILNSFVTGVGNWIVMDNFELKRVYAWHFEDGKSVEIQVYPDSDEDDDLYGSGTIFLREEEMESLVEWWVNGRQREKTSQNK